MSCVYPGCKSSVAVSPGFTFKFCVNHQLVVKPLRDKYKKSTGAILEKLNSLPPFDYNKFYNQYVNQANPTKAEQIKSQQTNITKAKQTKAQQTNQKLKNNNSKTEKEHEASKTEQEVSVELEQLYVDWRRHYVTLNTAIAQREKFTSLYIDVDYQDEGHKSFLETLQERLQTCENTLIGIMRCRLALEKKKQTQLNEPIQPDQQTQADQETDQHNQVNEPNKQLELIQPKKNEAKLKRNQLKKLVDADLQSYLQEADEERDKLWDGLIQIMDRLRYVCDLQLDQVDQHRKDFAAGKNHSTMNKIPNEQNEIEQDEIKQNEIKQNEVKCEKDKEDEKDKQDKDEQDKEDDEEDEDFDEDEFKEQEDRVAIVLIFIALACNGFMYTLKMQLKTLQSNSSAVRYNIRAVLEELARIRQHALSTIFEIEEMSLEEMEYILSYRYLFNMMHYSDFTQDHVDLLLDHSWNDDFRKYILRHPSLFSLYLHLRFVSGISSKEEIDCDHSGCLHNQISQSMFEIGVNRCRDSNKLVQSRRQNHARSTRAGKLNHSVCQCLIPVKPILELASKV